MRVLALAFLAAGAFAQGPSKGAQKVAAPPLYEAIRADDFLAVRRLVNSANVDAPIQPPSHPDTPLGLAAYLGRLRIVRYLVEDLKADIMVESRTDNATRLPAELAVSKIQSPEQRATAAFLLPRYAFYEEYLAKVKAAGPYAASSFAWPEGVKVLFVGERHGIADFPPEVIKLIEALPVTHYATEFLLQSDQETIDAYESDAITEAEFAQRTRHHSFTAPVAAAAKKKKVKIVGLEKLPGAGEDSVAARNRNWLGPILDIVENIPDAKMLVYCGTYHSRYFAASKSISELVAEKIGAEKVYVAAFAGGTHLFKNDYYDLATYMGDKAGRAGDDFKAEAKGASEPLRKAMPVDAVIHLKHASLLNP